MIARVRELVDRLHAAIQARKVNGEDHAAWHDQVRMAHAALRPACGDQRSLRLVRLGGSLYWNDRSICTGGSSPIARALSRSDRAWLSIDADAEVGALEALARACDEQGDLTQGLKGVRGVHVGVAVRTEEGVQPDQGTGGAAGAAIESLALVGVCDDVEEGLEQALHHPAEAAKQLVGVIDRIAAVVASAQTAMLPLASLKSHDEYTYVHTVNVGIMSAALAEAVGLRADQVHDIMLGAILHDIGKQLVPPEILNKGGKLSDAEVEVMRRHPVDGARVLLEAGDLPDVVPIIAFEHHMHVDGGGYPRMPNRWACNLAGQIVHVADVFDALRTNRPYRSALSTTEACNIMYRGADREFDSGLLDAFFQQVVIRSERDAGEGPKPAAA